VTEHLGGDSEVEGHDVRQRECHDMVHAVILAEGVAGFLRIGAFLPLVT
jgi:hypothetical protein